MAAPGTIELPKPVDDVSSHGDVWIVTVFDNSKNTYQEVIGILMLATCCEYEEAYMETWEIDHLGKSVVHHGAEDECSGAAAIIGRIGIEVKVSCE